MIMGNPFAGRGFESQASNQKKIGPSTSDRVPALSFEARRSELFPEVRSHVDKLYAELQSLYAKYFVKSVKELYEKAQQGRVALKIADTRRIDALVEAIKKALETNKLEGFERILTLGPNEPMIEWHASDGHIYIERKQKNGEKAVLLDGRQEVYRGRFKGCLVRDGEVYINEAEGSRTNLDISRVGAKKRFGFEKKIIYRGSGTAWEVSGGKVFVEDRTGRFKVSIAKKHQTFGADETEVVFKDDGRSMLGRPQYDNGHVYVSVRDERSGEFEVLKDGKPWRVRRHIELWSVEGGKLVEFKDHFDGTRERFVDGVQTESLGERYGNHYYRAGRGPNDENQIIQDDGRVVVENAQSWRFNEDALYVRVPNTDGGSTFFKITGNY